LPCSLVVCALLTCAAAAQPLRGVVRDAAGAVVPGAELTLSVGGATQRAVAAVDGSFQFERVTPPAVLTATAPGFGAATLAWDGAANVDVVLPPARVERQLVVTATCSAAALGDVAASVTRLDAAARRAAPPLVL